MRIPFISLGAGALVLGGCAYGNYGYGGVGLGYGDYGYGSSYYGYGYSSAYYRSPYFGWYDDFYYPGTGIYVYDTYRRPHVWSDHQRTYWISRRQAAATTSHTRTLRVNWSGFDRRTASNNHQPYYPRH